jgi:hypothetical protein
VRHGNRPSDSFALPSSIVREFAALSDHAFDRVLGEVRKANDLRLSREAQSSLRADLGDQARVALMVLSFARSIFNTLHEADDFEEEKRDFLDVMQAVLTDELGKEGGADKIVTRLDALLQPWSGATIRRKREWLESGVLKTAVEFASFVDLRPDFSVDRSDIGALVPIIIMEITARSDSVGRDAFQFQMGVKQFDEMKKLVQDVELKLETLSARYSLEISDV